MSGMATTSVSRCFLSEPSIWTNSGRDGNAKGARCTGNFPVKRTKTRVMRFCVEFDNATESNARLARDKVFPGIQNVHSPQFQDILHTKVPARWLTVATGPIQRYKHLRSEVAAARGPLSFLFTQAQRVTPESVLTGKIWQLAHRDELFSLDDYETDAFQTELIDSVRGLKALSLL